MAINERATVEVQVNGNQAKQELRDLESYANSLKGRLAEAYKAGDTKQIKKLEAELRKTNAELKTMRTNAKNIDVAMNNIGLATPKELRQLLKDINAKLNSGHIKRGSAEWKMYQDRLKLVNAEIKKVNAEMQETQSWLTRFNNGFSRWGGLLASGAAAITGVSFALSKMRNNRDDKEDSAANLKALTGLDDKSIQWLTRQAEILSTAMDKTGLRVTQSSKDILEAYMLVGSAKPELLSNKEALNAVTVEAMRLSTAAKMDLKEAVDAVTLSMNQYGASADDAAKYTNVMAAGSKFGSAAVQSITAAVTKAGVSASGANVSIEELVGTIETLAEKGIKDEVAGTGLKMFFLRLQTGADETNPKIVGLQTALNNLQKLSVEEVVKRFGAETYTVAKTLIDGADKVEYYTKAVTSTTVAMEQAAINSDTAKAKRAQYINQIKEAGITLMERLNPSLSVLTGWTTKLIKVLPGLIDWFQEYGKVLTYAIVVVSSYTVANKLQWFWLNKVKTETGQYIVIQKLKEFWDKAVAASTWLYIAATSALTGKTSSAKLAMQAFFMILKMNPLGAIATLIIGVAGALYLFTRRASEAQRAQTLLNEIQGDATTNISAEKAEIEALYKVAKNETKSQEERLRAIKQLNEISPKYLGALNLETIGTDNARIAVENYVKSLLTLAEIESAKSRLTDTDKQLDELRRKQGKYLEERETFWGAVKSLPRNIGNMLTWGGVESAAENLNNDIQELEKQREQLKSFLEEKIQVQVDTDTITNNNDDTKKCPKCGNYPCTCRKDPKPENNKLLTEEKRYQNELKQLKEEYIQSDTMSQDEYKNFLIDLELRHLNRKLEIAGLETKKREDIEKRILDIQMKFKEKCLTEDNKETKKYLTIQEKRMQLEVKQLAKDYKDRLISREEFLKKLLALQDIYSKVSETPEALSESQKAEIETFLERIEEVINKYREAAEETEKWEEITKRAWNDANVWANMSLDNMSVLVDKLIKDLMKVGDEVLSTEEKLQILSVLTGTYFTQMGTAIGKTFGGAKDSLDDFLKDSLIMVLNAIKQQLIAEQIAAIASVTIKEISSKGFIGIATAAAKIALITAAFETANSAISNFYTGGFTSPGEWDRPQGIVHSNEFVANRFAVANPEVLPVLKLIDTAQKNNTVGRLTSQDVSSVLRNGGQNQAAAVEVIQTTDPELKQLIVECTTVMQTVKKRFEKRIVAETYVTGKGGINKALSDYDKLMKNVKR